MIVILFTILLYLASVVYAQDYYYSDNRKIYFSKSDKWITIVTSETNQARFERALSQAGTAHLKHPLKPERGVYWLEAVEGVSLKTLISQLQQRTNIQRTIPAYFTIDPRGDTTRFIMSDEFHVKFHPHITKAQNEQMNAQYGVEIISASIYDEYILRVSAVSEWCWFLYLSNASKQYFFIRETHR